MMKNSEYVLGLGKENKKEMDKIKNVGKNISDFFAGGKKLANSWFS